MERESLNSWYRSSDRPEDDLESEDEDNQDSTVSRTSPEPVTHPTCSISEGRYPSAASVIKHETKLSVVGKISRRETFPIDASL